ncbi:MAG: hypothetical protein ABI904_15660 [Chloroflexota bacterium]
MCLNYDTLAKMTLSVVVEVNRAVAVAMSGKLREGLQIPLSLELGEILKI